MTTNRFTLHINDDEQASASYDNLEDAARGFRIAKARPENYEVVIWDNVDRRDVMQWMSDD